VPESPPLWPPSAVLAVAVAVVAPVGPPRAPGSLRAGLNRSVGRRSCSRSDALKATDPNRNTTQQRRTREGRARNGDGATGRPTQPREQQEADGPAIPPRDGGTAWHAAFRVAFYGTAARTAAVAREWRATCITTSGACGASGRQECERRKIVEERNRTTCGGDRGGCRRYICCDNAWRLAVAVWGGPDSSAWNPGPIYLTHRW
jgi:hypothetical protein